MSNSMLARDLPSYRKQGSGKRLTRNVLVVVGLVFLFVTILEGIFLQSFRLQTDAMSPNVTPGSMVLVTPLLFGKESLFSDGTWLDLVPPQRGDLVMMAPPWKTQENFAERIAAHVVLFFTLGRVHPRFGGEGEKSWEVSLVMRRIIAVPGDQIYLNDGVFYVKPKGKSGFTDEFALGGHGYKLKQSKAPIRDSEMMFSAEMPLTTVGPKEYFVAADNRESGLDSRHWGPIDAAQLRGLVLANYWPLNRLAWFP
jgi:signal peptidase I